MGGKSHKWLLRDGWRTSLLRASLKPNLHFPTKAALTKSVQCASDPWQGLGKNLSSWVCYSPNPWGDLGQNLLGVLFMAQFGARVLFSHCLEDKRLPTVGPP